MPFEESRSAEPISPAQERTVLDFWKGATHAFEVAAPTGTRNGPALVPSSDGPHHGQ